MVAVIITISTFLIMEAVTWLTHKFVMHGFLWALHRDHHKKDHDSFFERNDYFFVIFAIPSIILFAIGNANPHVWYLFYIALGITIYGFAYFMVHEIFIHQRFKLFSRTDNIYFRAIRKAHKVHHKHLSKEDGECFGMLMVPFKYFMEAKKNRK